MLAWLRMVRFTQHVGKIWSGILRMHGLSPAQFNIIATVGGQPGLSQQELSQKLLVTQGNSSQLLLHLERRGLIERRAAGKEKLLSLTPSGQALFDDLVPAHEDWLVEQFAALNTQEQAELAVWLRRLERTHR
ncbi:MarR family winged helix-turn-helix transcriptional regulator [Deinococcus malanensis]|uniref:MarR family winged helix-turn-helix transcriptional regulator n=1 Tax=Deinococcus malanensis TaxID=1706855 RepID=UPI0036344074